MMENLETETIIMTHTSAREMVSEIFTKALPLPKFRKFVETMGMRV